MTTKSSIQNSLPIKELFVRRNNSELIHDQVAPTIFSDKVIGHYYRLKDENLVPENDILGSRSGANEIFHNYEKQQFNIYKHGLKEFIDYSVIETSDWESKEQLRKDTMFMIKDKLLLKKEIALANLLTNPSNFSGSTSALAGTDRWDNASSDPTNQFKLMRETIRSKSGKAPNTLILGAKVNDALSYNSALANRVSLTDTKVVSKSILADMLKSSGINIPENRILVADAQYKTVAGGTPSYVWGNIALFAYIDPNTTTLFDDTLVKQFRLKKNAGVEMGFYKENDPTVHGEWGYGQIDYGFELVNYQCGYLFTTVVS
jgi:phage pi2 protein 07